MSARWLRRLSGAAGVVGVVMLWAVLASLWHDTIRLITFFGAIGAWIFAALCDAIANLIDR